MSLFEVFCAFLTFFAGMGFAACLNWLINRAAVSVVKRQAQAKGQQAKQEQEIGLLALVGEIVQGFNEAKEKGEDMRQAAARILPAAAAHHPLAAIKLGQKVGKKLLERGGFESLGEWLE